MSFHLIKMYQINATYILILIYVIYLTKVILYLTIVNNTIDYNNIYIYIYIYIYLYIYIYIYHLNYYNLSGNIIKACIIRKSSYND